MSIVDWLTLAGVVVAAIGLAAQIAAGNKTTRERLDEKIGGLQGEMIRNNTITDQLREDLEKHEDECRENRRGMYERLNNLGEDMAAIKAKMDKE